MKQNDLILYFGGKVRVSEIVNRKKNTTLAIARRLHQERRIPAQSLLA